MSHALHPALQILIALLCLGDLDMAWCRCRRRWISSANDFDRTHSRDAVTSLCCLC